MSLDHLVELANRSGGTLYLMAVLLLIALTVIFDRIAYLSRMQRGGEALITTLRAASSADGATLRTLMGTYAKLPHVRVIEVALMDAPGVSRDRCAEHIEEVVMHEIPMLDRSLWILDTVITLAPLLGLFGTILGMFGTFSVLSDVQNNTGEITGGIAEALLATASGLVVAMIGLMFFNGLNTKVRVIVHQLEVLKVMLLNRRFGQVQDRLLESLTAAS
jgi:biopolymer transport protein ExbB